MDYSVVALILWKVVIMCYAVSSGAIFFYLVRKNPPDVNWAKFLVTGGFTLQSSLMVWAWIDVGMLPVGSFAQALRFFSWALAGLYVFLFFRYRLIQFGLVLLPLATLMWAFGGPLRQAKPLPPFLMSPWLVIHGLLSFLGEATLVGAFAASVLYLMQENRIRGRTSFRSLGKLPALEVLDQINYKCMAWGFVLLTAGIITGAIWANQAWGAYWTWQAKETWALVTWLVYAGLLHQRLNSGWGGRRAALLALLGFGFLLFTFIGAGFVGSGPHRFDRFQG